MSAKILTCTADKSPNTSSFFQIEQIPIFNNVLWESAEAAHGAARGDLELAFCKGCGHIYNSRFQPELMAYDVAYENSLHFSAHFQQYVKALCSDLIERYDLRGKTIIDVGCGKGDFLKLICEMGANRGYGFDKSYEPHPEDATLEKVQFFQEFFDESYAHIEADMIVCRHVLEHIQHPAAFLQGIRAAIGDRRETVVVFEVPNGLYTLRDMGIWDIIYEHCSYFTPNSLAALFAQNGFDVLSVQELYGGQFLSLEARPAASLQAKNLTPSLSLSELDALVQAFSANYAEKMRYWQQKLGEMRSAGQKVVIWGTGSKGVTFLNALSSAQEIRYAVDINPRKQGKFVAGTGQKIIAPEFLLEYQPDVVIVMNPLYIQEIRANLAALGLHPELLQP